MSDKEPNWSDTEERSYRREAEEVLQKRGEEPNPEPLANAIARAMWEEHRKGAWYAAQAPISATERMEQSLSDMREQAKRLQATLE